MRWATRCYAHVPRSAHFSLAVYYHTRLNTLIGFSSLGCPGGISVIGYRDWCSSKVRPVVLGSHCCWWSLSCRKYSDAVVGDAWTWLERRTTARVLHCRQHPANDRLVCLWLPLPYDADVCNLLTFQYHPADFILHCNMEALNYIFSLVNIWVWRTTSAAETQVWRLHVNRLMSCNGFLNNCWPRKHKNKSALYVIATTLSWTVYLPGALSKCCF